MYDDDDEISHGARGFLSHLTGSDQRQSETGRAMRMGVPTVVKLEDPLRDVDATLELLNDGEVPERRARSWMQRHRSTQNRVERRDSGLPVFEGRSCCFEHFRQLQRQLAMLRLPYDTECPQCHARYRIELQMR